MASVKLKRLEKSIEREVARIIQDEVKSDVGFITITGVDLTNDLSFATVYYTVLGNDEKKAAVQKRLDHSKGFIKIALGKSVQMRKMPELIFTYDESIEYGEKIEGLIKKIKNEDD